MSSAAHGAIRCSVDLEETFSPMSCTSVMIVHTVSWYGLPNCLRRVPCLSP